MNDLYRLVKMWGTHNFKGCDDQPKRQFFNFKVLIIPPKRVRFRWHKSPSAEGFFLCLRALWRYGSAYLHPLSHGLAHGVSVYII